MHAPRTRRNTRLIDPQPLGTNGVLHSYYKMVWSRWGIWVEAWPRGRVPCSIAGHAVWARASGEIELELDSDSRTQLRSRLDGDDDRVRLEVQQG